MARYKDAFYQPLVADLSNFGAWSEAGAKSSTDRATAIWKQALGEFKAPENGTEAAERIAGYVADRKQHGGAAPTGG